MQHQYWVTKQALSRKLGKKEDDCIVASDAELDAKLELFRSIQESCSYLQRVIDKYQERLCSKCDSENDSNYNYPNNDKTIIFITIISLISRSSTRRKCYGSFFKRSW